MIKKKSILKCLSYVLGTSWKYQLSKLANQVKSYDGQRMLQLSISTLFNSYTLIPHMEIV
jgi:hypothetical protein